MTTTNQRALPDKFPTPYEFTGFSKIPFETDNLFMQDVYALIMEYFRVPTSKETQMTNFGNALTKFNNHYGLILFNPGAHTFGFLYELIPFLEKDAIYVEKQFAKLWTLLLNAYTAKHQTPVMNMPKRNLSDSAKMSIKTFLENLVLGRDNPPKELYALAEKYTNAIIEVVESEMK